MEKKNILENFLKEGYYRADYKSLVGSNGNCDDVGVQEFGICQIKAIRNCKNKFVGYKFEYNFNDGKKNVDFMNIDGNVIHTTSTDTFMSGKWSFDNEKNRVFCKPKGYCALLDTNAVIQFSMREEDGKYIIETLINNKKYGEGELVKIC